VTIEPHIDASPAVDPAGLKVGDRVAGDPVDKYLEQQKLVIPSYGLGGFSDCSRLIHIVVDAPDGVIDVVGKFSSYRLHLSSHQCQFGNEQKLGLH
jgi:hypothetical protein